MIITHEFKYTCDVILKSGKIFKRIGIINAIHQHDAVEQIKKLYNCKNVVAKPNLKGKAVGSDLIFNLRGEQEKFVDRIN